MDPGSISINSNSNTSNKKARSQLRKSISRKPTTEKSNSTVVEQRAADAVDGNSSPRIEEVSSSSNINSTTSNKKAPTQQKKAAARKPTRELSEAVDGNSSTGIGKVSMSRNSNGKASNKKASTAPTNKRSAARKCTQKITNSRAQDPAVQQPETDTTLEDSEGSEESVEDDPYWRAGDLEEVPFPEEDSFTVPPDVKSPIDYFNFYFDNEILEKIVSETNIYSTQKTGKCMNLSKEELQTFLGILIYFGICTLPSARDYWASKTAVKQVSDAMTRNRYKDIHRLIHFHNNEEEGDDRMLKVRPILSHMRKKCQELEKETKLSVDERMQGYKGTRAGNMRQYLPDKPSHKWGFKIFVLAGKSGMTYDFIVYSGADTFSLEALTSEERDLGIGASAVIALCKSIERPEITTVTFDNWYTGLPLIAYLRDNLRLHSMGTIRRKRLKNIPFSSAKEMEKKGRGDFESQVNAEAIVVVQWADNKVVCLASSYAGVEPMGTVKRYSKEAKAKVDVPCPRAILLYNSNMGGVDLSDMYMALYSIPSRARRWYFSLFGYCLELALTNSYLQYRRDCKLLGVPQDLKTSKEFRIAVSETLRNGALRSRGRPSLNASLNKKRIQRPMALRPDADLRLDGLNHWPDNTTKGRCKYCSKGFSRLKCTKCNLHLCLVQGRNCFVQFHLEKQLPIEIARAKAKNKNTSQTSQDADDEDESSGADENESAKEDDPDPILSLDESDPSFSLDD